MSVPMQGRGVMRRMSSGRVLIVDKENTQRKQNNINININKRLVGMSEIGFFTQSMTDVKRASASCELRTRR